MQLTRAIQIDPQRRIAEPVDGISAFWTGSWKAGMRAAWKAWPAGGERRKVPMNLGNCSPWIVDVSLPDPSHQQARAMDQSLRHGSKQTVQFRAGADPADPACAFPDH